jgi:hypothetical protein
MAGHFSFKVAGIVSGTTQIRSRPTEADPLIFLSRKQTDIADAVIQI